MNATKITNGIFYGLAVLSSLVALLQVFNWTAFLTPEQTVAIMAFLNGFGAALKGWMATAEAFAKNMAATNAKAPS